MNWRGCHTATEEDRTLNIQLGKLEAVSPNLLSNKNVTESQNTTVLNSVFLGTQSSSIEGLSAPVGLCPDEAGDQTGNLPLGPTPDSLASDRLSVIADLLADLVGPQRQTVIDMLNPEDRASIAVFLLSRDATDSPSS